MSLFVIQASVYKSVFHFGSNKSITIPLFLTWNHWIGNTRYLAEEQHLSELQQGWSATPSEGGCPHPTWGLQCPKQNSSSPFTADPVPSIPESGAGTRIWWWAFTLLHEFLAVMYLQVRKGVCSALILGNAMWQRADWEENLLPAESFKPS